MSKAMLNAGLRMVRDLQTPRWSIGISTNARVIAHRDIKDSPLAREDNSIKKGTIGRIEDVDTVNRIIFVEFNDVTIACDPDDIRYI